jgi:hypothetical protein
MHRKSSSHRHTEISLPLQLIGQYQKYGIAAAM